MTKRGWENTNIVQCFLCLQAISSNAVITNASAFFFVIFSLTSLTLSCQLLPTIASESKNMQRDINGVCKDLGVMLIQY